MEGESGGRWEQVGNKDDSSLHVLLWRRYNESFILMCGEDPAQIYSAHIKGFYYCLRESRRY